MKAEESCLVFVYQALAAESRIKRKLMINAKLEFSF